MKNRIITFSILIILCYSCSTPQKIVRPQSRYSVDTVDFFSLKQPPRNWWQLDQQFTQFPGISCKLAYKYVLNNRNPKRKVIVAVLGTGVNLHQADLNGRIWTNKGEIPDNGKDDDHNGYVDDVHGWNFLGGSTGKNVTHVPLRVARLYIRLYPKYHHADTTLFTPKQMNQYHLFEKLSRDYKHSIIIAWKGYKNTRERLRKKRLADSILSQHFKGSYSYKELNNLHPATPKMAYAKSFMIHHGKSLRYDSTTIAKEQKEFYELAKGLNLHHPPRHIVGDNINDKSQRYYGNNAVDAGNTQHGTAIADIIAGNRNNSIGMNGIAGKNVRIMPVRVMAYGYRDKDLANGIGYAVDNGADIINISLGSKYSFDKKIIEKAIKYAGAHHVLIINSAGNAASNTDKTSHYPMDFYDSPDHQKISNLWLTVGATNWKPNKEFVAHISNYGAKTVDLFAPGYDIYTLSSTSKGLWEEGTSFAAAIVSGVAAVLMEYYPKLTAAQVKKAIMQSIKTYPGKKVYYPVLGHKPITGLFSRLSVSGGEVNLFNALQAAQKMSR
jgi:subtilisin family serine protease